MFRSPVYLIPLPESLSRYRLSYVYRMLRNDTKTKAITDACSELFCHRDIAICDLLEEAAVWFVQHDVEVLECVNAFQALPILEPDKFLNLGCKCPLDIAIDLFTRFRCAEASLLIVLKLELGPNHPMHYVWIDAVRPVIVQNLYVLCSRLEKASYIITRLQVPAHSKGLPFG